MGGTGSGRRGGGPTVESAFCLDMNELRRIGAVVPGAGVRYTPTWSNRYTGAVTLKLDILSVMFGPEAPRLVIRHMADGRVAESYTVHLESSSQPFGGERWWFLCPLTHQRVGKLYLPRGARWFASREAYRLDYRSQRSSPRDRAIARGHKIRRSLGAEANPLVPVQKPHRMRWATFNAKMARLAAAERSSTAYLLPVIEAMERQRSRRATL